MFICIGTVGVLSNSGAVYILSQIASQRKKLVNILLVNQSAIDLVGSLLVALNGHNNTVLGQFYTVIGLDFYCKLFGSNILPWGVAICSTFNLVFLNLERYISVVFPIFHKTTLSKAHMMFFVVFAWVFGLLFEFCLFYPTSGYSKADSDCVTGVVVPHKSIETLIGILNVVVTIFVPIILMIYFYIGMFKSIRKVNLSIGTATQPDQKKGRNILKTLALVTLTFILCWIWNGVAYFLYQVGVFDASIFGTDFYLFSQCLTFINFCLNPFIYCAQYRDFQDQLKKLVCRK